MSGIQSGFFFDGRVGYLELVIGRTERDPDLGLFEVAVDDRFALDHCVQRSEPLLPVDDQLLWGELLAVRADLSGTRLDHVLPEQEVADRIHPVHRVEEITDFDRLPHEGTLDVRQPDRAPCRSDRQESKERPRANRIINIALSTAYGISIIVGAIGEWNYYILGSVIEVALLAAIAFYAWTWPKRISLFEVTRRGPC